MFCFVKGTVAGFCADLCNKVWDEQSVYPYFIIPVFYPYIFSVRLQIVFYFKKIPEYFGGDLRVALEESVISKLGVFSSEINSGWKWRD